MNRFRGNWDYSNTHQKRYFSSIEFWFSSTLADKWYFKIGHDHFFNILSKSSFVVILSFNALNYGAENASLNNTREFFEYLTLSVLPHTHLTWSIPTQLNVWGHFTNHTFSPTNYLEQSPSREANSLTHSPSQRILTLQQWNSPLCQFLCQHHSTRVFRYIRIRHLHRISM
jgi:hypothetical protein